MSFLGFGKKKAQPSQSESKSPASTPPPERAAEEAAPGTATPQAAAPTSATAGGDWRQPSLTTYTAKDVGVSQEDFDAAFAHARKENDRGAPFGGALWGALMPRAQNHQAVDDMIDELPTEAFGQGASPHFEVIIRCWARAVASDARPEWQTFKSLAMAGGWRPGDANSTWLYEQVAGEPPFLQKAKHPMGLDLLPGEFVMSRTELAVYSFLNDVLNKSAGQTVQ